KRENRSPLVQGFQLLRRDVSGDFNPITSRRAGDAVEDFRGAIATGGASQDELPFRGSAFKSLDEPQSVFALLQSTDGEDHFAAGNRGARGRKVRPMGDDTNASRIDTKQRRDLAGRE